MRDYYARNRKKQQRYQIDRAAGQRRALAVLKVERGCRDCPERDSRVLQFHHRDESAKKFTIGSRPGRLGMPALLAEVEKCDVLCANCHIKEHVQPQLPPGAPASGAFVVSPTVQETSVI